MKPGDRSRCIRYKANYGTVMPGNKLELCTFAATMPRMPHKTGSSGFILGEYGNARQRCKMFASCRASVERVKHAHKPIKNYRREKTWQQLRKSESS